MKPVKEDIVIKDSYLLLIALYCGGAAACALFSVKKVQLSPLVFTSFFFESGIFSIGVDANL